MVVQEYYTRHIAGSLRCDLLPATPLQPVATLMPPLDEPSDLLATLQGLIDGSASVQVSKGRHALPLLVQRGAAVVQRSNTLLSVFRTLSHSLEDCAQLVCASPPSVEWPFHQNALTSMDQSSLIIVGLVKWGDHQIDCSSINLLDDATPRQQCVRQ